MIAKKRRGTKKSMSVSLKIWWRPSSKAIHIHIVDAGMTTVSSKPGARYQKHLFNKLATCLREAGRPAPSPL
jgi:hypothetical protein